MTTADPTNRELLDSFERHAKDDKAFQDSTVEIHAKMEKRMDTLATKEDVRDIFASELKNFFKVSGLNIRSVIVGTAMIIGALTVIFGGFKTFLGWLGFTLMK